MGDSIHAGERAETMGIGLGIGLTLVGLTLVLRVFEFDVPGVDEYRLGVLLTVMGLVSLVLAIVLNTTRRRSTHVIEREREF